ncbi:hypothetical protein GYH30_026578 [Glycine max]|uniref:Uncharacterized protein n=1 Tax=Glycine max TaxID=3847 RepID=K7LGS3_SOYBN|nr:hypothetical protein GYH30_026578 [Glycine max]
MQTNTKFKTLQKKIMENTAELQKFKWNPRFAASEINAKITQTSYQLHKNIAKVDIKGRSYLASFQVSISYKAY